MFGKYAIGILFIVATVPMAARPLLQAAATIPAGAKKEVPFSNEDVIKLTKLQLGDDVIIAKIKQAGSVAFDLTTDGLIHLKQSAVSSRVISAMLERSTAKQTTVSVSDGGASPGVDGRDGVRLIRGEEEIRLPSNRGDLSTTGMWPVVFTFLDYPGRAARTRTSEVRPTLIVQSEHDPNGYYYLAKLDVNDEEDNNRSLKIEQKMSGFTATTRVVPSGRWYVEYDAAESSPGVWRITPRRDLDPGEYGVVVPGGVLYEFGVD